MTVDAKSNEVAQKPDLVNLTIDGVPVSVPKGTLIIRAAEMIGTDIPRFCDHPLLDPVGACRQCMVEIPDAGNGRGFPKPQASCTMPVAEGMVVKTQLSSAGAKKAQEGILELLLVNHPLDCPICDKGGECPLQNQAMSHGHEESRFDGVKRTFPKPVSVSAQILLDRERCVLCARCTRFSEQISGDPFISLVERGALQQVGFYEEHPYESYFSGNVIQICPVGALTSANYRFQARPFDLVSTKSTCEHCSGGCELRIDHRHHQVKRRLAGNNPEVNEEWICDKGRFGFEYARTERLKYPLVRRDGKLQPASWPEAIDAAVRGLKAAGNCVGVITGGRLTVENSFAYAKFARVVLGTNNIDYRTRPHSAEEAEFLAALVAGKQQGTYRDLEEAKRVILVAYEPEDEAGTVFLRLRKAVRKRGLKVETIAPFASYGSKKLSAQLIAAAPGEEPVALQGINDLDGSTVIVLGQRAATIPGLLSTAARLAEQTGVRLVYMVRRAGDRGALDAGCMPNLLPGGRPVEDAEARVDVAAAWSVASLPAEPGLAVAEQFLAAAQGKLQALVIAGMEPDDMDDVQQAYEGLEKAEFVVSIEQRSSAVTQRADVVFPAALIEEQSGHFRNWEGRDLPVGLVSTGLHTPMTDLRILSALSDAMGVDLALRSPAAAWAEFQELSDWEGSRLPSPNHSAVAKGEGLVLATWNELIDDARGTDNALALRATARPLIARVSAATAEKYQLGEFVKVSVNGTEQVFPLVITEGMVDDVLWAPQNPVQGQQLAAVSGAAVTISAVSAEGGEK